MSTEGKPETTWIFQSLIANHYADLKAIAKRKSAKFGGEFCSPTSLVHQTTVRLLGQHTSPSDGEHFLAVATLLMNRLLLDRARRRTLEAKARTEFEGGEVTQQEEQENVENCERLAAALEALCAMDARKAEILTLHVICGMTMANAAAEVGVSVPTAERDVRFAKAWLGAYIKGEQL